MRSYSSRVLGRRCHRARVLIGRPGRIFARAPVPFILAFRNLVHDKTRLAATLAGLTFAVVLVGVQLGLYLGVRKIITDMIDHTAAQVWIVPFGTQSIEDSFPLLGDHERQQALATPGCFLCGLGPAGRRHYARRRGWL